MKSLQCRQSCNLRLLLPETTLEWLRNSSVAGLSHRKVSSIVCGKSQYQMVNIGVADRGLGGGAAALPTLKKFAKYQP